jgi:hypothetical protein
MLATSFQLIWTAVDRPDIADVTDMMIYEIKPKIDAAGTYADIAHYMALILTYGGGYSVASTSPRWSLQ